MNELVSEYKDAAKAFNLKKEQDAVKSGYSRAYGTVPSELKPWEYEFLHRLYSRDEFDKLCSGPDRHAKFAMWAVTNYTVWTRETERAYAALFSQVEKAAGTFKLEVK